MKKTNLKYNTIANYIGQGYSMLIGIVILPFYLQYLGDEAYGLVGFFTMLMAWMLVLDLGLSATLTKESATLKDKPQGLLQIKQLTVSIELIFLLIAVITFMAIFLGSGWLAEHWLHPKTLSVATVSHCIKIMGVMVGLRWLVGLYQGGIIGFERQVWLNIYKIGITTLKFIGGFILIKYITHEIFHFFIYQLLVGVIELAVIKIKLNKILNISQKVKFSLTTIKAVMPFALSIAYTAVIWTFASQLDKLILSHYLSLKEYGFFSLVIVIASSIFQLFQPVGQAILPRMTSLLANNKEHDMLLLYHKATQFISTTVFSVSAMVAFFSYDLLYAWTGNVEVATWGAPVLFWYALGNGIVTMTGLQYYLQYAHGNLKYHVRGYSIFIIIQTLIIIYAAIYYGVLGVAVVWCGMQIILLLIWPAYIHSKFASGIHKEWLFKDVLPGIIASIIYLAGLHVIALDFSGLDRIEIFITLIILGIVLLAINSLVYKYTREVIFSIFRLLSIRLTNKN